MSSLIFLYPHWLGLLVPLLLLAAWRGLRQNQRGLIAPHLAQALGIETRTRRSLGCIGTQLDRRHPCDGGPKLAIR